MLIVQALSIQLDSRLSTMKIGGHSARMTEK